MRVRLSRVLAATALLIFLPSAWLECAAADPASAREFVDGDYVVTSCTSVAAYAEARLWEAAGVAETPTTRQLFTERAESLSTQRIGSVEELKSLLASGEYFPKACWAGGVKGAPAPRHIPYFAFPTNLPYEAHLGPRREVVRLHGSGYVQLFPRALSVLWTDASDKVASEALTQSCDTYVRDPTGGDRHRRELADPVAAALAVGGWPSLDAYLAQRETFQSYRQLVAKYRWSPSNGFIKNVATHFKQNEIQNPSDTVKNGQRSQKAASDLILHAAAVHPELAQGTWLQSMMQLVEPGPDVPAFASMQEAQSRIAGFAGFAQPAELQVMEHDWIFQHAAPGVYVIDERNRFQCLGRFPALWQGIFKDLEDQAKPPHDPQQ
jgi:hypothetical protein